jgi:hypothetical protein
VKNKIKEGRYNKIHDLKYIAREVIKEGMHYDSFYKVFVVAIGIE